MVSIFLTNVDLRDVQKEHLQRYATTTVDVHPVLLPRHFLSFCFASPQDHLIVYDVLRLYVTLHQSPLIIYLGFEAAMATHNLIKKCSYRQSCLISDSFGFQPFSETTNADNNMVLAIHLRETATI